jgi:polysaccharide chain length determinant protein (PEP-CTERM system associated)
VDSPNDSPSNLILAYLHGMWRRKWIAAAICWGVCLIGWAAVYKLPDSYQSDARVYVDVNSLLTPLLKGLAIDSDPLHQLDYMQRTLLSRPNLEQVIHLADLDAEAQKPAEKDALILDLSKRIRVSLQGHNLFNISYADSDAARAKRVVNGVLTVFSESTAGNNRSQMDTARRFIDEQIASYEKQLRAAEARRAQFRETYGNIISAKSDTSISAQASEATQRLRNNLADAQAKRDAMAKELASTSQYLSTSQAAAVVVRSGETLKQQLDRMRQKLIELQSRFTDQYPDVITLKRDIVQMQKELASQKAGGNSGEEKSDSGTSTSSNPVYEQLKLRLFDAEASVASLKRQLETAEKEQKRIADAIKAAPGIQLQSQNLDRDYDILKKNFQELVQRREAANLAQAADTQADKVQFRIIDPPQVPLTPAAPNRLLLNSGVLIFGLGAGVGAAFLLIQLDRSFSSLGGLRSLGLPVLGSISRVNFLDWRRRNFQQAAGLAASAVGLLLVYGVILIANLGLLHGMI